MNASFFNYTNQNASLDCFNQSTPSNVTDAPLFQTINIIRQYVPPVFLLMGIFGNLLTMAVLLRQGKTINFTGVSLLVLATVDNMSILSYFLPDWLGAVAGQDFRSFSNLACQISMFFTFISQIVSPWALVVITIERVVCLVWPFKAKKIFTVKLSLCLYALISTATIVMCMYVFEVFEVSERALNIFGFACGALTILDDTDVTTIAMNYLANSLIFHLPFALLIAGNSIILYKLYSRKKFSLQRGDAKTTIRYRNLSILVAALNVVFFFSQFPLSTYELLQAQLIHWALSNPCTDQFWHRLGVFRLILTGCNSVALVSPSTNFLLYFVSSASFRKEIKAFLKCERAGEKNLFNS